MKIALTELRAECSKLPNPNQHDIGYIYHMQFCKSNNTLQSHKNGKVVCERVKVIVERFCKDDNCWKDWVIKL